MRELIFDKGLLEPTLQEKKKITIRKFRPEAHCFVRGDIIRGIFKDGLNILLMVTYNTEIKTPLLSYGFRS